MVEKVHITSSEEVFLHHPFGYNQPFCMAFVLVGPYMLHQVATAKVGGNSKGYPPPAPTLTMTMFSYCVIGGDIDICGHIGL